MILENEFGYVVDENSVPTRNVECSTKSKKFVDLPNIPSLTRQRDLLSL
jgi:hypothetical protein